MHASAVRRARRAAAAVQRGQALPLALGLLLAGAAMMAVMVSAGQVVATKQRLTDTADAAAWSAATWRARVLNYHAYSNRAIVANEVAIAQAVALRAWTQYFETLTRNAAAVGSYLPVVGPALAGVAEAAALARESARIAAELEIPARGAEGVGYKEILQASQEILHLSSQAFAASMVAAEVARATDPDFFAWVLPDPDRGWQRLTRRADSIEARRRTADLVRASLEPFTAGPRNDDITVPVPSPCLSFMRMKKRGITTLSEDLDRWESVDTLSFHVR
ncbi:MAG TPA: pilus assembly protein TadG-related protein, partial [Burkholderiaceae bacterium]|nr:pilus assembly protein TadG-related protein [Burkholderiaceae bacterium]